MTDETSNLILEHRRGIRNDIAAVKEDMRGLRERMSTMEAQLTGLSYLITTGLGSVPHDMDHLKGRAAALEGTH